MKFKTQCRKEKFGNIMKIRIKRQDDHVEWKSMDIMKILVNREDSSY